MKRRREVCVYQSSHIETQKVGDVLKIPAPRFVSAHALRLH
jgi:hypothetical protein